MKFEIELDQQSFEKCSELAVIWELPVDLVVSTFVRMQYWTMFGSSQSKEDVDRWLMYFNDELEGVCAEHPKWKDWGTYVRFEPRGGFTYQRQNRKARRARRSGVSH